MNESLKLSKNFLPMRQEEMYETRGGSILLAILGGLAIAAGGEIIGDWDNFKNGLRGRPEE
jgi:hypothetical protein